MARVVIQLLGPLTATGSNGEDLTPKGGKVAGLLALLAATKGRYCSRAWLQEKLWSDRGHEQGRDSLRHALGSLKSALGDHASVLLVDGQNIAIDKDAVLVDIYDKIPSYLDASEHHTEFLDGLIIRDRKFDAWLQGMRRKLSEHPCSTTGTSEDVSESSGFRIAILPVESLGQGNDAYLLGVSTLGRLATSLQNLGPFSVFDYSDGSAMPEWGLAGPDVFLTLRSVQLGDCFNVALSLSRVMDRKVVWSAVQAMPAGEGATLAISGLVIQMTDQIARALHRPGILGPMDRHQAARLALGGIQKMFSLQPGGLTEADEAFKRAIELEGKGVYYAWHAYSVVFKAGELDGTEQNDLRHFANHQANQALALDGSNPLTLALLTQVYAFVFRDYNRAQQYIEPAIAMQADSLMALDSLALLNFYIGNIDTARSAATKALDLSLYSPYRYCFATTMCMIETVAGNYDRAIEHGERALALHSPDCERSYAPALRYLSAAYAHGGKLDAAAETYRALRAQEPHLTAESLDPSSYPIPNAEAIDVVQSGFRKIEATFEEEAS